MTKAEYEDYVKGAISFIARHFERVTYDNLLSLITIKGNSSRSVTEIAFLQGNKTAARVTLNPPQPIKDSIEFIINTEDLSTSRRNSKAYSPEEILSKFPQGPGADQVCRIAGIVIADIESFLEDCELIPKIKIDYETAAKSTPPTYMHGLYWREPCTPRE